MRRVQELIIINIIVSYNMWAHFKWKSKSSWKLSLRVNSESGCPLRCFIYAVINIFDKFHKHLPIMYCRRKLRQESFPHSIASFTSAFKSFRTLLVTFPMHPRRHPVSPQHLPFSFLPFDLRGDVEVSMSRMSLQYMYVPSWSCMLCMYVCMIAGNEETGSDSVYFFVFPV